MADGDVGAVRRTPRAGRDDLAEITVPCAQSGAGATNTGSAAVDAETITGDGTGDLRAKLIEDLRGSLVREPEEVGETSVDQWYVDEFAVDCSTEPLLRVLARGLLAAGWRPGVEQLTRDDRRGLAAVFGYELGDADARRELEAAGWRPPLPKRSCPCGHFGTCDHDLDRPSPLPDSETECATKAAAYDRIKARIDEIQARKRYALVNVNQLADLLRPDGLWSTSFAAGAPATPEREADRG